MKYIEKNTKKMNRTLANCQTTSDRLCVIEVPEGKKREQKTCLKK